MKGIENILLPLAILLPVWIGARLLWRRRAKKRGLPAGGPLREIAMAIFALFMAGLIALVLVPEAGMGTAWQRLQTGAGINLVPGATIQRFWRVWNRSFVINVVGNVVMLVPPGFFLPLLWRRWRPFWKSALAATLFPVCIEITQLFIGRHVDVDDVILNMTGMLLGYGLCRLLVLVFKRLDGLCLPAKVK